VVAFSGFSQELCVPRQAALCVLSTQPTLRCVSGLSWDLFGPLSGARTYRGFQKLGDTTAFFNSGDGSQVIGSIGIGFAY
jgi:hypothetical protein